MNIRSPLLVAGLTIASCLSSGLSDQSRAADQKQPFEPTMLDVSHLSCEEVWIGVAKKDDPFIQLVELLAHHILTRREVKFPDTDEAGKAFGDAVVKNCLANPDELLYSAVNRSLRDTLPVVSK
jgi:hypothetical protein